MIVVYNNYYDKLIPYNNSTCMRTILWISVYEDFKFHSIDDLYRQLNYNGALLVFYNTE